MPEVLRCRGDSAVDLRLVEQGDGEQRAIGWVVGCCAESGFQVRVPSIDQHLIRAHRSKGF